MTYQTHKTFIEINGVLYQVLKQIRETDNPIIDTWKEHLRADKAFKQNGVYFFVREVPEAEIVADEILTTDEPKPTE